MSHETPANKGTDSSSKPASDNDAHSKLRAALAKTDLTPEQTQDDVAPAVTRDSELLADVPPHHIEH